VGAVYQGPWAVPDTPFAALLRDLCPKILARTDSRFGLMDRMAPNPQQDTSSHVTRIRTPDPAPVVDGDLLRRAVGRDAAAFGELYEAHLPRVFRHVRYRVPEPELAEDITSMVFLRAWQAIDRYKPVEGRPFLAWLFTIANNLIVDHHRRARHVVGEIDPGRHRADTPDPEESAISTDLNDRILAAIARLKPDYQLIVSLRLIEDMEYEDIARVMGKKPGALRVLLFRALASLRDDLSRGGVAP
jgi:RNA polymerase sigma-70 factor, ECF subfamily